jgi:phosphatidylserine/phosphatidylglycerophosphate/cardiolipin synthase-like enzyme
MLKKRGISTLTSESLKVDLARIREVTRSILRLTAEQMNKLAELCLKMPDPSHFTAERLQRELRLSTADAVGIARVLSRDADIAGLRMVAALAAATAESAFAREQTADKVDVVCTAPVQFEVPVRATFATMMEMVQEARSEIVVVGYVFTAGASELVRRISQARQRGLAVTIIGNRMRQSVSRLRAIWGPGPAPAVYGWDGNPDDEMASLHAKLLICDKETALVTSANYSLHGLHENVEIGLRVRSLSVVRLSDFVRQLIVSSTVLPVAWD